MVALMRVNATSVAKEDTWPETAGSGEVVPHLQTTDLAEAEPEEEMAAKDSTMVAVDLEDSLHTKQHSKGNATIVVSGATRRLTVGSCKTKIRETVPHRMKLVVLPWRLC